MPKQCDCPGRSIYDSGNGGKFEVSPFKTKEAALQELPDLLPEAKAEALSQQQRALERAIANGDSACKPGKGRCKKCEAWFRAPDLGPPWTRTYSFPSSPSGEKEWGVVAYYEWTIEVDCRCPCAVDTLARGKAATGGFDALRRFRDQGMKKSPVGRRYLTLFDKHNEELIALFVNNSDLLSLAQSVLPQLLECVPATTEAKGKSVAPKLIKEIEVALELCSAKSSESLRKTIAGLRSNLRHFSGVTIMDGLARVQSRSVRGK